MYVCLCVYVHVIVCTHVIHSQRTYCTTSRITHHHTSVVPIWLKRYLNPPPRPPTMRRVHSSALPVAALTQPPGCIVQHCPVAVTFAHPGAQLSIVSHNYRRTGGERTAQHCSPPSAYTVINSQTCTVRDEWESTIASGSLRARVLRVYHQECTRPTTSRVLPAI